MKKVYFLSALFFISNLVVAQTPESGRSKKADFSKQLKRQDNPGVTAKQDRAAGDIIWSNDFSTASDWTAAGPSTDYESNGWSIGSTTNGWYFGTTANMGTTGDFARFTNGDPNLPNDVVEDGPFTLEYNGTINLSGIPAPHLEFEQYGSRFITIQAVEVSTDGGNNWIQAANNNDLPPTTDIVTNIYGQPELRRFNLTNAISGNPSNVKIRLFWDGDMNGGSMNYVAYGWYVDNIRVVEGFSYDSKLISTYHRCGVGGTVSTSGLEYGMIALSQSSPIEFSGTIENNGGSIQTDSYLDIDVSNSTASVFTDASPNADIGLGALDSFVTVNTFEPAVTGSYEILFTANQLNPDGNTADNSSISKFVVTEHLYGRDNNVIGGGFQNFSSNGTAQVTIGNSMEIFEDGLISAMEVVVTTSPDNEGQTIFGRIFKLDNNNNFQEIAITDEYEITSGDLGIDNPISLPLTEIPLEVFAGDELLVAVGHYGDPGVTFATAQSVQEGSVLGYPADGTSLTQLIDPEAIMVRLDMRDFTSIKEDDNKIVALSQNVPNPIINNAVISYTLNENAQVSLDIVDVTGKVVQTFDEGMRNSGDHSINISAESLSNGMYFYTLKAGETTITKRMIVSK